MHANRFSDAGRGNGLARDTRACGGASAAGSQDDGIAGACRLTAQR